MHIGNRFTLGCFAILLTALGIVSGSVQAQSALNYSLTALNDPVALGQTAEFDMTVSNPSGQTQNNVTLYFTVPAFTFETDGNYNAGSHLSRSFGTLLPGETKTRSVRLLVLSATNSQPAAPEGSSITLSVTDQDRGATLSRSVTVRNAPVLGLDLGADQGSIAPGQPLVYTLTYHSNAAVPGAVLRAPLPAGATLVAADGGGALGADGAVQWSLGALAAGSSNQLHLTVAPGAAAPGASLLTLEATLSDSNGDAARASAVTQVNSAPQLTYSLTALPDPVALGQTAEFDVTVSNPTSVTQNNVTLYFTVPAFTFETGGNYNAGSHLSRSFGTLLPGQAMTRSIELLILSATNSQPAAPEGSSITLSVTDQDRGATLSRSVTVRNAPVLGLDLGADQGSIAPGQPLVYTLTYHSNAAVPGAVLRAALPAGATLVAADGGGALGADGAVQWSLGALAAGISNQLHLTVAPGAAAPGASLLTLEATLSDSNGDAARASAVTQVNSAPQLTYSLTALPDPVALGQTAEFDVTVSNPTSVTQNNVTLYFTVPAFTFETGGNYNAGSRLSRSFGTLLPGQAMTRSIELLILSATNSQPAASEGSSITLSVTDQDRGATLSRSVTVRNAPVLELDLGADQGSIAPGQPLVYTLTYHSNAAVPGAVLRAPLPAGATLVAADGGGALGADGAVQWSLGALAAGSSNQLHLTVAPGAATPGASLLALEATLSDSNGDAARASAVTQVNSAPQLTYSLTALPDPVALGQTAEFDVTVSNPTSVTQNNVTLYFTVPAFTFETGGNYNAGSRLSRSFGTLLPGQAMTRSIELLVLSATNSQPAAPEGSSITLSVTDQDRGATLSHSVIVRSTPQVGGTATANATQGQPFSYQIAASNNPTSFDATGLPAGLSVDTATGLISGTPSQIGVFSVTLSAANAVGASQTTLMLTVAAAPITAPVITSPLSAAAQQGQAFSYQITASNSPVSYDVAGLPGGLSLDPASGLITGAPTQSGTFNVTLNAANGGGTGSATLTLIVNVVPEVTIITLGDGLALEGGRAGKTAVQRSGDTSKELIVQYKVGGGAKAVLDYKPLNGLAVIPAGASRVKIKIKPVDNLTPDGVRVAKIKLQPSADGSYTLGSTVKAKIRIIDND